MSRAGPLEHTRPVDLGLPADQLAAVANPSQAAPTVFRSVRTQIQNQVFRGKRLEWLAAQVNLLAPQPQLVEVDGIVEIPARQSFVQLNEHLFVVFHEDMTTLMDLMSVLLRLF